jgi:hypothetical protein
MYEILAASLATLALSLFAITQTTEIWNQCVWRLRVWRRRIHPFLSLVALLAWVILLLVLLLLEAHSDWLRRCC